MTGQVREEIEWWTVDLGPDSVINGYWCSSAAPAAPQPAGLLSDLRDTHGVRDALAAFRETMRPDDADGQLWPTGSAMMTVDTERTLARTLGSALLPGDLVKHLETAYRSGDPTPLLRIHAAGRVADIPWEILAVDEKDTRLVERAEIRMIPPPADPATPVRPFRSGSACLVIDPTVEKRPGVLDPDRTSPLFDLVKRYRAAGALTRPIRVPGSSYTRDDLRRALEKGPDRLLYFGHVTASATGAEESDAIHLSDEAMTADGRARPVGDHSPFSALDLRAGPKRGDKPFPVWPMPPRVAIIGCGSGRELVHREPFGLVSAILRCGAGLVTATRWPLPTDRGMRDRFGLSGLQPVPTPTSDLAVAVDRAQASSDPIGSLTMWKREQLGQWRSALTATDRATSSPLLWGALADFEHPPAPQVATARNQGP